MKTPLFILITSCCLLLAVNSFSQGTWTQKADFGGGKTYRAVGFVIGTKSYIGTGLYSQEFWEWDQGTNVWTRKADYPGGGRDWATGFSIGSKGYIGTGSEGATKNDFWEWDQATNVWTKKANIGPVDTSDTGPLARVGAVGFSIGTKGYIGTGYNGGIYFNDFWEYDPLLNTWTQKANFGGVARFGAVGFSIGNKGYIGTGQGGIGNLLKDFWEYNPISDTWIQKANFGGMGRYSATAFVIGTEGYIGTGLINASPYNIKDFWKWDQSTNQWTQIGNFNGSARSRAVGFSIGNLGYVGTGSDSTNIEVKDFWEFSTSCGTATPSICMVTTETASNYNYNVVAWDKTQYSNVDSFIVYRKDAITSNYLRIGAVSKDSLSAFTDTALSVGGPNGGNPQYSSWLYKLAIRDSCGNIGAKSPYHQTMFVQRSGSNFSWNAYTVETGQTNPLTGYSFLRDNSNTGNWNVLVNTVGLTTTDPNYVNYPNGNWRIDALGFNCSTTRTQSTYLKSHSNTTNQAVTGIKQLDFYNKQIKVYPNPTTGYFVIETSATEIQSVQVFDLNGRLVFGQNINDKTNIDATILNEGIYNLSIKTNDSVINKKLVIIR